MFSEFLPPPTERHEVEPDPVWIPRCERSAGEDCPCCGYGGPAIRRPCRTLGEDYCRACNGGCGRLA